MGASTLEIHVCLNSTKRIFIDSYAYAEFKTSIRFQISCSVAEVSLRKLIDFHHFSLFLLKTDKN